MTMPKIYGWNKSSEAGPDNFAPSIFLGGCNYRCPYCMNSKLVTSPEELNEVDIEEIDNFIIENECEWVNISGGEPTVQKDLVNLINHFRLKGCKVALSTNGSNPDVLWCILPILNYVTIDLKTSPLRYDEVMSPWDCSMDKVANILLSLHLIRTLNRIKEMNSCIDFDYEIRTTLYPPLVGHDEIDEMGRYIIRQDERWVLQPFRVAKCMLDNKSSNIKPYSQEELDQLKILANTYCDCVILRNV